MLRDDILLCRPAVRRRKALEDGDIVITRGKSVKSVLWGLYERISRDRMFLVAAGITFYGLLALFPALAALVSITGFFVDPDRITDQLQSLSGLLPTESLDIIAAQIERIANQPTNNLSFAFVAGLGIALWSANNGIKAMFDGLNVVQDQQEQRSFLRLAAVSLLFTVGAIGTIVVGLCAIVVVPAILAFVGLDGVTTVLLSVGRWPVLFALIVLAISLLYQFGPSGTPARRRWITIGSIFAALSWVAASALFSWYLENFSNYNEIYGSLGAVIAFMVWLWISASIILLGAELDAELARQPVSDNAAQATAGHSP